MRIYFNKHIPLFLIKVTFILIFTTSIKAFKPGKKYDFFCKDGQHFRGAVLFKETKNAYIIDLEYSDQKQSILKSNMIKPPQPIGQKSKSVNKKTFLQKSKIETGIQVGSMLPVGNLTSVITMGLGGSFYGSLLSPYNPFEKINLEFRLAIIAGFYRFNSNSSDFTATLSLIPVLMGAELGYPLIKHQLVPFVLLAGGTSVGSLNKTFSNSITNNVTSGNASTSISTLDAVALGGLGIKYYPRFTNKVLFMLDGKYTVLFEDQVGSFLNITLSAFYRF